MHVVTDINGRGALPVRAIPLLTDWRGLSPDQLAQILAGDSDHWPSFEGLTAYRLQTDGSIEAIPPQWWQSWVVRKLNATSDAIKAKQTSHETGYQQWRSESLAQLPSGVFVWRDEFEVAHVCEYGPLGRRARGNPNGFDSRVHVLNFNPHPDLDIAPHGLVLEGFDELKAENEKELHLHDVRISLKSWATLHDVRPNDAALLLCGYDPDKGQSHTAKDFLMLARCFTDHAQKYPAPRRLAQWWALVLEWTEAKKLGFTTPNRDIGEALMIFDRQHHPRTESAPAQPAESDSTPSTAPVPDSASNAPACDFSMLATREQLIEAFGRFTGMEASWFKNIKDTPALLSARKVAGQGGRGHIAEPLFCPFEVMQWLTSHKRRKNKDRKLSAEKAWELLEKNFPKVHSARSVADPRTGD